jgi:nucleotide-binding universal stress UspA family protein
MPRADPEMTMIEDTRDDTRAARSDHDRRIVVGVDGSEPARRALEWAAAQAGRTGATLDIRTAAECEHLIDRPGGSENTPARLLRDAAGDVRRLAPEVATTEHVAPPPPAADLVAASAGAELLVVGARGRGGFGVLIGSVGFHCLHLSHCPVVIVHPTSGAGGSTPGGRIVVGFDGTRSSVAALEWAARQAELTSSKVEVVTAWEWPKLFGTPTVVPSGYRPGDYVEKLVDEELAGSQRAHPTVSFLPSIVEEDPSRALVESSRDADLLVVGSRGRGELGSRLGSVSEHCAVHADPPVVVCRGFDPAGVR